MTTALPHFRRRVAAALLLALAAGAATAHDSWFERLPGADVARPAEIVLGTGNAFPVLETPIDAPYLARAGCHAEAGAGVALGVLGLSPTALRLRPGDGAATCYVQTTTFDVLLDPALVPVYLQEVRPPPAVAERWAALRARGLAWAERYTKHARIALRPGPTPRADPPLGMDAVIEAEDAEGIAFRVLRDGAPLPGFAVELRHERAPVGVWRRTDADGRLRFAPTLAGAWLLRGIDLRPSPDGADGWDSRFVTLAFEVQDPSRFRPKARSASQTAASAAISSEPPTITPRR